MDTHTHTPTNIQTDGQKWQLCSQPCPYISYVIKNRQKNVCARVPCVWSLSRMSELLFETHTTCTTETELIQAATVSTVLHVCKRLYFSAVWFVCLSVGRIGKGPSKEMGIKCRLDTRTKQQYTSISQGIRVWLTRNDFVGPGIWTKQPY